MSKKIIAGAAAVAVSVGSFAMLSAPIFAAPSPNNVNDAWHQVTVTPSTELILGGSAIEDVELNPTITDIDSASGAELTVKSSIAWDLEWQAVKGEYSDEVITGSTDVFDSPDDLAPGGTNLGTSGFTGSGGYAYAGAQTEASIGVNNWGVVLDSTDLTSDPALSISLSPVASGSATSNGSITSTYSAGTNGSLGQTTYYGTIYFVLSAN
jgi:hypothetical protein